MQKGYCQGYALLLNALFLFYFVGCSSDSGNNTPIIEPTPIETRSNSFNFDLEVTGSAVKGTMINADVSVVQLDSSGQEVPVPFRLAQSAIPEVYVDIVTTDTPTDTTDAGFYAQALSVNPTGVTTDSAGGYTIFLENDFTGTVIIRVTASGDSTDGWIRCDAYTGCGSYGNIELPILPNNGDLVIDFGEWYKDDLSLTVVKVIEVDSSAKSSDKGMPSRRLIANVTVLTQLASQILLQQNTELAAADVAQASLQVITELLGPEGAIAASSLLGDISTGGALDLADVDADADVDTGIISLVQLSASLQSIAGDSSESLNDIIGSIATGITAGNLNAASDESDFDPVLAELQSELQDTVETLAEVFVAAVTGNDPNGVLTNLGIDVDEVTNGLEDIISDQELQDLANETAALLEDIGCSGDECDVASDNTALNTELFDQFSADLAELTQELSTVDDQVGLVEELIIAAQAAQALVNDGDTAVDFYLAALAAFNAVYEENDDGEDINMLGREANRITAAIAQGIDNANFLISRTSTAETQLLLTNFESLADDAAIVAEQVNGDVGVHQTVLSLFAVAEQSLADNDAITLGQRRAAETTVATSDASNALAATSGSAAVSTFQTAQAAAQPANLSAALDYQILATTALTAANDYVAASESAVAAANAAIAAVDAFDAVATSDEDIVLAEELATQAANFLTVAQTALDTASAHLSDARAEQDLADDAVTLYQNLEAVKTTTQSLVSVTIVSQEGREMLLDAIDLLSDVVDEAVRAESTTMPVESENYPGWTYLFNEDNLTLEASHSTQGSLKAAVELFTQNGETSVVVGFEAAFMPESGTSLTFASGDVAACADAYENGTDLPAGSCMRFILTGAFSDLDDYNDESPISYSSGADVVLIDGELGFTGRFEQSQVYESATIEEYFTDNIVIAGTSREVTFEFNQDYSDISSVEEFSFWITVGDEGYRLTGEETEQFDLFGDIYWGDTVFGSWEEVETGINVDYIDNTSIDYVIDFSFTSSSQ